MKVNLKLARISMNMEEATIVKWHKLPGESFASGEALYEIETEKAAQEIEAPGNGTLIEIRVAEGEDAEVEQCVCVVEMQL